MTKQEYKIISKVLRATEYDMNEALKRAKTEIEYIFDIAEQDINNINKHETRNTQNN